MSPLRQQSTVFVPSTFPEGLNSEPFWIDGAVVSAFHEETSRLFERAATPIEAPPALPTDCLLPFDDDHLGPPPPSFGDVGRVDFSDFAPTAYNRPFGIQPDDLYAIFPFYPSLSVMTTDCTSYSFGPVYQDTYSEMFQNDFIPCAPAPAMPTYEISAPVPCDTSVTAITQTISPSATHLPPAPVDPSTMTVYPPYFGYGYDSSEVPSTPDNASVASLPPSSPPTSSYCGSSESDGEGDVDYIPPSDDDEEYRPIQAPSPQKQKKPRSASQSKSPSPKTFSPTRSTSSESGSSSRARRRSHPYKRTNTSRNLQRDHGPAEISKRIDFFCPVIGCDYEQKNHRIPDLKRHIVTHGRWIVPDRWTCCGVTMDRAYLYGIGIEPGMTDEECIEAGAYTFRGQLRIGGCLKTFARRDALKRHVDNPNLSCIGHMDTYY
jgi:hypothetical protein